MPMAQGRRRLITTLRRSLRLLLGGSFRCSRNTGSSDASTRLRAGTAHTGTSPGRQAQLISAREEQQRASAAARKTGSGHVRRRVIEKKRQRQFSSSSDVAS
ncbi:hypothetical protein MRX96_036754 [Rhipicephalus microplus]